MFALVESGSITKMLNGRRGITIDGVQHPQQIFTIWTDAQRKDLGIVPVVISGSHLNTNYYIEKNHSDAIAGDGNSVIRTIGVKEADRKLENEDAKDEDGNQMITRGLKYNAIQKVKSQQAGFLSQTDWYIIRKADAGTAIPSNIQTWRNAIRSDATAIETAITNAADMDAFIALHTDTYKTVDGKQVVDVVARVNRWTKLGT